MTALPGGLLILHCINRKNAPFLFFPHDRGRHHGPRPVRVLLTEQPYYTGLRLDPGPPCKTRYGNKLIFTGMEAGSPHAAVRLRL